MQLKFKNGKFRVLQVSDPQDLQYVRHTMMRMLNKAYDDLIAGCVSNLSF